MKNSRYGVPRTFSATTWRLPGSSSPACGNFAEDEGEGRRRSEVTVGVDGCLRVGRGELDVDREVRGWMIQRPSVSHSRPEMTYHRPHFGSAKGGNRERERATTAPPAQSATPPLQVRVTVRTKTENPTLVYQRISKRLPAHQLPLKDPHNLEYLLYIAPIKPWLILLLHLLRLQLLLLQLTLSLSGGSRRAFPSSQDLC